jgi:cell division protease FtsH
MENDTVDKNNAPKDKAGKSKNRKNIIPMTQFQDSIPKRPWYKNPIILLIVLFLLSGLIGRFLTLDSGKNEVDFGTFVQRVAKQDYEKVEVEQVTARILPKDKNEKPVTTAITSQEDFRQALRESGVEATRQGIEYKHPSNIDFLSIISTLSLLIFIGVIGFSFFSAKNMASGGPMMGFGDTKAKLFIGRKQDIKFDQIQGADEAVDEVKEIVSFLKNPEKYIKLGARIPKGVLLVGQPGTGKTLLARAIAGEAAVPFFFTSGSEFEEMLVGTGASRVRDLFTKAKKAAPAIIFIDEIDSIARKRGLVLNSGNTEQTLNQILVEMDGFDKSTNVIVIAATNRPDVLDPAILRPGRFDRRVVLELPDVKGREEILKVHSKNKPLAKDVELATVAKRTIGFSGADLENTLNEAAIIAAKDGRTEITMNDIEEAATKVTIGPAKKRAKSEKQKRLAAYHEAGHAIAGYYLEGADRVHRISIVSRGYTGGVTMYLPEEDDMEMRTEAKFKGELITLYGGRSAEKIALDSVSTGASSDIKRATQIARDMVKKYGMSPLGYIDFDQESEYYQQPNPYSEKTAEEIDRAVSAILAEAMKRSEEILTENRDKLDKLAEILVEKEVVESEEFYEFMKNA